MTVEQPPKIDKEKMTPPSSGRRGFIKASGMSAAAAIMSGITSGVSHATSAKSTKGASNHGLEKTKLNVGIIPLTDCAPIVIAKEKGFFEKHGLDVTISKEASWANIRDKVSSGILDGAHMLAGMPIANNPWDRIGTKTHGNCFFYGLKWQWHYRFECAV